MRRILCRPFSSKVPAPNRPVEVLVRRQKLVPRRQQFTVPKLGRHDRQQKDLGQFRLAGAVKVLEHFGPRFVPRPRNDPLKPCPMTFPHK